MSNKENTKSKLSRYKIREQAFFLCFEKLFNDYSFEDIFENTLDGRDITLDQEAIYIASGVEREKEKLDDAITKNLKKGWSVNRLSKVSYSILKLALYEMFYMDSIPISVSINEAVELSKKYSTEKDSAFVNGVLGSVAKEIEKPKEAIDEKAKEETVEITNEEEKEEKIEKLEESEVETTKETEKINDKNKEEIKEEKLEKIEESEKQSKDETVEIKDKIVEETKE